MRKILQAFNKLVFKKPRPLQSITTITNLSLEVQKDFLIALQELFIINKEGDNYLLEYIEGYCYNHASKNS